MNYKLTISYDKKRKMRVYCIERSYVKDLIKVTTPTTVYIDGISLRGLLNHLEKSL